MAVLILIIKIVEPNANLGTNNTIYESLHNAQQLRSGFDVLPSGHRRYNEKLPKKVHRFLAGEYCKQLAK